MARIPRAVSRRAYFKAAAGAGGSLLLAACGGPETPGAQLAQPVGTVGAAAAAPSKGQTKISFATDWNSGVRKDTIDFALAEFAKRHPEITVEAQHIGAGAGTSSVGGFSEQIVATFVAGNAADLIFSWIEIVGTFRNFLTELTPVLKTSNYSQLGISEIPFNTHFEGKQYGINFAPATGGWLYNISMFEKNGIPLPSPDWTWDDALVAMKSLTKPEAKQWGFWSYNYSEYGYLPHIMSNGGSLFSDPAMKTVALCNDNGTEAFQWWVDLIYKHKVSPEPGLAAGMKTPDTGDLFQLGLVGIAPAGFQSVGTGVKLIGDRFRWGLIPYPRAQRTNDRRYLAHTEPLVVPKSAETRGTVDAALKLALHLAGDDAVQNYIAENRPTIPVKTSILNGPAYAKAPPENMALIGKQLGDSARQYQTRPLVKWYAEFTQKLMADADKAFIGESTAADAWKAVCRDTQQVVSSAGS